MAQVKKPTMPTCLAKRHSSIPKHLDMLTQNTEPELGDKGGDRVMTRLTDPQPPFRHRR